MPLYEYRCRKCGAQIEKIQKFSASPLGTCQACGGQLERLLSTSSIRFKGSGWYVTDYAQRGRSDTSGKDEAGATAKSETTPAKPDSAPADKGTKKDKPAKAK